MGKIRHKSYSYSPNVLLKKHLYDLHVDSEYAFVVLDLGLKMRLLLPIHIEAEPKSEYAQQIIGTIGRKGYHSFSRQTSISQQRC